MKWYDDSEYQLMCEKAKEIQKEKIEIDFGDYYAWHDSNRATLHTNLAIKKIGTTFWLPSQEDLQKMVHYKDMFELDKAFHEWFEEEINISHSMSQAWLAFVYHELYQKQWNHKSKEWEKIE